MSHFLKRLDQLLEDALKGGVLDATASDGLRALARERESRRGVLSLASVLAWLGGGVAAVGLILLIAANWQGIPREVKLGGFILLFTLAQGAGLWIRWKAPAYQKTAQGLHLLGGGLFLAGVGLVAQVYNLNDRPPNGVLLWLGAIAPLAFLLSSPPLAVLSVFSALLWAHLEGNLDSSPLRMVPYSFTPHLIVELGTGAALLGFSALLRDRGSGIARTLRVIGAILLAGSLYLLVFYRHFSHLGEEGSMVIPGAALALGAAGLALGGRLLAGESPWFRNRLLLLLSAGLGLAALGLLFDQGGLPRGGQLVFFNFGWDRTFDWAEIAVSAAAWMLWFLLSLWCVAFGARSGRKAYLNGGAAGVGLGVVTLFFDLLGSLATTGGMFLAGGLVLLGTGFAVERWRRRLVLRMGGQS